MADQTQVVQELLRRRDSLTPDKQAIVDELAKRMGVRVESGVTSEANKALSGTGLSVSDPNPPKPYGLSLPKEQAARQANPMSAPRGDIIPYEGMGSAGTSDVIEGLGRLANPDRDAFDRAIGGAQATGGALSGLGPFAGGHQAFPRVAKTVKNNPAGAATFAEAVISPKTAMLRKLVGLATKENVPPKPPPPQPQWGSTIPPSPNLGPNLQVNPAGNVPPTGVSTPGPVPPAAPPPGYGGSPSRVPTPPPPPPVEAMPPAVPSTNRVPGPMPPPQAPPVIPSTNRVPGPPPAPPAPPVVPSTNRMPGPIPTPQAPPTFGGSTNRPGPGPVPPTPAPPVGATQTGATQAPPPPAQTATVPSTANVNEVAEALKNELGGTPGKPLVIPATDTKAAGDAAHLANRGSLADRFITKQTGNSKEVLDAIKNQSETDKAIMRKQISEAPYEYVGSPETQQEIFRRLGIDIPSDIPRMAKGGVVLPAPVKEAEAIGAASTGEDVIRGSSDIPLAPQGKEQAETLGKQFKARGGLDSLESGDLVRAHDTAMAISKACSCSPVTKNTNLRPWMLGGLEGQPTLSVLSKIHRFITKQPNVKVPGKGPKSTSPGESFNAFKRRFLGTLKERLQELKKDPNKRMALVTHYRDIRIAQAWADKGFPDSMEINPKLMLVKGNDPPASVFRLYWKGSKPALEKINMAQGKNIGGIYLVRHGITKWNEEAYKQGKEAT